MSSVTARAKINLYLHVVGKRADGYHLLDSLITFTEYGDEIDIAPADELSLNIDGPFADGLSTGPDNLVLRAANGLRELCGVRQGAAIRLTKNLPLASGIGGGSADAAATFTGLMHLWELRPEREPLFDLALKLGADVPICLYGINSVVSGVGEVMKNAGFLPRAHLLLVNPLVETPTPQVFKARSGPFSEAMPWKMRAPIPADPTVHELAEMLKLRRNDLTDAAIKVTPVIADVLAAIGATPDCLLARLSGSGATCFGMYETAAAAEAARRLVLGKHPDWWAMAAPMAG